MQALANIHRLFVELRWIGSYLHDLCTLDSNPKAHFSDL